MSDLSIVVSEENRTITVRVPIPEGLDPKDIIFQNSAPASGIVVQRCLEHMAKNASPKPIAELAAMLGLALAHGSGAIAREMENRIRKEKK